MKTTYVRGLLVHLIPYRVNAHTWLPRAVIEVPKSKEISQLILDIEVKSEDQANIKMLLEAHASIQTDAWQLFHRTSGT
ncbi:hypothetical protein SAMN05216303_102817 [Rhodoferax sp. OV413]|uniref:hypothetical protein n=1 Tax=Rhodoferax sp. OV413 TaxID=1855285 RepID=UPI00088CA74B|nr:hypothetical protein [Rhodoferax sp. OV413]SDO96858.1 hypothetical protein SAMN05216303_102817 [Rhodoferax sp. OV413]